jgi:chromatin remodeling complex protein RSC6
MSDSAAPPAKKARASKEKKPKAEGASKGGGGFSKECNLSAKLSSFMGSPTGSRTNIVKQLWVRREREEKTKQKN